MKPKRMISGNDSRKQTDAKNGTRKVESLAKPQKSKTKKSGNKTASSETRKRKDRKNELISKVRRRLLNVRKRKNKDLSPSRRSFERSPGPSPASAIIPPPAFFKLAPYKLRSQKGYISL